MLGYFIQLTADFLVLLLQGNLLIFDRLDLIAQILIFSSQGIHFILMAIIYCFEEIGQFSFLEISCQQPI